MQALLKQHRHRPRRRSSRWRRLPPTAASGSCRKRSGPPPRPSCGARAWRTPIRRTRRRGARTARRRSRPPMPRRRRSPSRSRCARRVDRRRQDRRAGHARPRAGTPRARGARRAGTSRSTIPAATRSPDTPAGVFARLAAEAALGGLAPVTLLALLKHPLAPARRAAGAHARAIAALERAVLRGPRPRRGHRRPRAGARDLARGARQAPARGALRPAPVRSARRLDRRRAAGGRRTCVVELIAALGAARMPARRRAPLRRARRAPSRRHRGAVRRRHRQRPPPSRGADGTALATALDEIADSAPRRATCASRSPTMPSCSTPPSRTAWCAGQACPACACAFSGRSKRACTDIDRVVLGRAQRRHLAAGDAQRRLAQPPDAARSSASICRSGASRSRPTISRRCSARAR